MIITLTKADFSLCKIGTLTTFNVRKSTVIGASVNIIKTSVERAGYSSATTIATIVLDEANYEGHAIKVMMGSTDVSSWYSVGKVIVPAKTPITSNITISVSATAVSGGDPIIPDVPVTPTMYTFTINPMVANATVTLTASGYKQSGNSISVPSGTTVSWTVSAGGYFDKNGSETVTKDKTLNVDLGKIPGPEQPGSGTTGNGQWLSVLVTGDANAHTEFMNYTDTIGQLTNVPCAYVKPEIQKHLSGKRVTKVACYVLGSDSSISFYTNDYSQSGTTSGDGHWQKVFTLTDPSSKVAAGTKTKKEYNVNFTIEEGDTLAFYDMEKMNSPANKPDLMSYVLPVNYTMNPGQKYGTTLPNFIAFDFYVE